MTEQLSDVHFVMQNGTTTGKVRVLILFYISTASAVSSKALYLNI